ncbi:hypothetical protein LTS18_001423, partial [Coniosporium uncinatum]
KDKTLETMDNKLNHLSGSVDQLSAQLREMATLVRSIPGVPTTPTPLLDPSQSSFTSPGQQRSSHGSTSAATPSSSDAAADSSHRQLSETTQGEEPSVTVKRPYKHLTAPHKVLLWPALYSMLNEKCQLEHADFQVLAEEGTYWFLRLELQAHSEPLNASLMASVRSVDGHSGTNGRVSFAELSPDSMNEYAQHYFNTFNVLYPLLDAEHFFKSVLPEVAGRGFSNTDYNSVIALLVMALGAVAYSGSYDLPINNFANNHSSGIRGGSADHPPGLEWFNQARLRIGFMATQCTLENVQALLLQAIYYQACWRHLDFWRS